MNDRHSNGSREQGREESGHAYQLALAHELEQVIGEAQGVETQVSYCVLSTLESALQCASFCEYLRDRLDDLTAELRADQPHVADLGNVIRGHVVEVQERLTRLVDVCNEMRRDGLVEPILEQELSQ